ncbi:MAG: DNA repair protein RecN [Gammaproteobacteria bacterium]|nr:MAG: DNA repair protein RecN [Gammaproteobacteria bacterium]
MLTHIKINHFAIVDELELDIPDKLTVITGETGAGKSIMLDALGLALGDRADSGVVRHGATKADIHAAFDISGNPAAQNWLEQRDLDAQDECILRRVVNADGRSKAYVNGSPQPITAVRELGRLLVIIHGQHEHQALLKKETHRELLDQFGNLADCVSEVGLAFKTWQQAQKAYETHRDNARELSDRADLLKFQLQEFDQLALQEGEYQTLEQDHKKLANVDSLLSTGQQAETGLTGDEGSAYQQTHRVLCLLQDMAKEDAQLNELVEMVESASIQLQEAGDTLTHYLHSLDIDPERYQAIDQRLSAAYQLARKHRIDPYTLPDFHQQMQQELAQIDGGEEKLDQLQQQADALKADYLAIATRLSEHRARQGNKLSKVISKQIKALGMPGAEFNIELQPLEASHYSAKGLEQVAFMVQTNPGQPAKPLNKVASGGELSRISLSIQVACAAKTNVATLMFDEVDVGIGGATAQVVGQLLRALGNDNQVICVTHQPQVAAQGHHHLYVNKQTKKQNTFTDIAELNQDEKVLEIARMLGGLTITDQTRAHAQELIAESQQI